MRLRSIPLALVVALAPSTGRAYDVEVDSETIGQGYQVLGAQGPLISRRRLDQYLGVHVWNLGPKDADGVPLPRNQFYFTSSMRLQFDLGDYGRDNIGGRDVSQELGNNRFELLWAYAGARDLFGFLDVKLGRQINYDLFEFLAYDGLDVEVKTPWWVAASLYGGLLVNGYLPIDSTVFSPDGTAPGVFSPHALDPKPLVGVTLRSFGLRDFDARFSYRRIFSPSGNTPTTAACTPGAAPDILTAERCTGAVDGTTEEKLAWSARGRLLDGAIIPWFGLQYDLLQAKVDTIETGVRAAIGARHGVQLQYLYAYPTFDGDSIWNLFVRSRFDDVRLGYDLRLGRVRAWATAFVRLFHDVDAAGDKLPITRSDCAPTAPSRTACLDGGTQAGARLDFARGYVRTDGYLELGYGGSLWGADVASRVLIFPDLAWAEGRLTWAHSEDNLRPDFAADSVGFQLGGRLSLHRGMLVHLLVEDNFNRFYKSQLRFYAVLDLAALLGPYGFAAGTVRGIGPGLGGFGGNPGTGY
jgi:hypothetical protein